MSAIDQVGNVTVNAVNAADGSLRWTYPLAVNNSFVPNPPIVSNGVVIFSAPTGANGSEYLYGASVSTGALLWKVNAPSDALAIVNGVGYFTTADGSLEALAL